MEPYIYHTGIDGLDKELDGGFRRGSMILLEHETGSPVELFLREFLSAGIDSGEQVYAILTNSKIDSIFDGMEGGTGRIGKIAVIDAFTDALGWKEITPYSEYTVEDITEIKKVHEVYRKAAEQFTPGKVQRGVIDSLSTLLMANMDVEQQSLPRYQTVLGYLLNQSVVNKSNGSIQLLTLQKSAQDEIVERNIENICDYVIRLEKKDSSGVYSDSLAVLKSRGTYCPSNRLRIVFKNRKLALECA